MRERIISLVLALLTAPVLLLGPGCAYRSHFNTTPDGATVTFEGQSMGATPGVVIPSRSGLPTDYVVRVSRPGYKDQTVVLERAYHADASLLWLIFGFIPYFFTARLEDHYHISLVPEERIETIREETRKRIIKEETIVE